MRSNVFDARRNRFGFASLPPLVAPRRGKCQPSDISYRNERDGSYKKVKSSTAKQGTLTIQKVTSFIGNKGKPIAQKVT